MIGTAPLLRRRPHVLPKLDKTHGPHAYGCLMAMLPEDVAQQIKDWSYSTISNHHLGPGGFETEPHITVLYGFTEDTPEQLDALKALLTRHGPISLKLGPFRRFTGGPDGDVLYVEVESPDLHDLHKQCKDFPHEDKYPVYRPHVTVAYLNPSFSAAYCALGVPNLTNTEVLVTEAEYSNPAGKRTRIRLGWPGYIEGPKETAVEQAAFPPLCPTCGGATKSFESGLVCAHPPCEWSTKDAGQPCAQGEAASRTGCIPASGETAPHKPPTKRKYNAQEIKKGANDIDKLTNPNSSKEDQQNLIRVMLNMDDAQAVEMWKKSSLSASLGMPKSFAQATTAREAAGAVIKCWKYRRFMWEFVPKGMSEEDFAVSHFPQLKALRGKLHISGMKNAAVKQHVAALASYPEHVLEVLAKAGLETWVSDQPVPENDEMQMLRGQQPRGWTSGRTWSDVPGAYYHLDDKRLIAGLVPGQGYPLGMPAHEMGHAVGDVLGFNDSPELEEHHKRLFDRLEPYLKQGGPGALAGKQETLAEGLAWLLVRGESMARKQYDDAFVDWLKNKVLAKPSWLKEQAA